MEQYDLPHGTAYVYETVDEMKMELPELPDDVYNPRKRAYVKNIIKLQHNGNHYKWFKYVFYVKYTLGGKKLARYVTTITNNIIREFEPMRPYIYAGKSLSYSNNEEFKNLMFEFYMERRDSQELENFLSSIQVGTTIYGISGKKVIQKTIGKIQLVPYLEYFNFSISFSKKSNSPFEPLYMCTGIGPHGKILSYTGSYLSKYNFHTTEKGAKMVVLNKLRKQIAKYRSLMGQLMNTYKQVIES